MTRLQKEAFQLKHLDDVTAERAKNAEMINGSSLTILILCGLVKKLSSANSAFPAVKAFCSGVNISQGSPKQFCYMPGPRLNSAAHITLT
jgi:hypothetical protein